MNCLVRKLFVSNIVLVHKKIGQKNFGTKKCMAPTEVFHCTEMGTIVIGRKGPKSVTNSLRWPTRPILKVGSSSDKIGVLLAEIFQCSETGKMLQKNMLSGQLSPTHADGCFLANLLFSQIISIVFPISTLNKIICEHIFSQ